MRNVVTSFKRVSSVFIDSFEQLVPFEIIHLLQACSDLKAINPGKQIHQRLILHGFHENDFISTKLVQTYADCDDIPSAFKVFDKLSQPNVFSCTSLISFFLRNGNFEKCTCIYKDMKTKGVSPDNYVFPKVLKACAANLCLEGGIQLHKDVIFFGSDANVLVSNALLDMYVKCGEIESGKKIFDYTIGRDLLSWNSMISGYVSNGFLELAVDMFNSMRLDGVEPDIVTWNTVIDAYCRMGKCNVASHLFSQINRPNIISWTILISGYSRIGNYRITFDIFRNMLFSEVHADLDCVSRVLACCQHIGALSCGREVHAYGIKNEGNNAFYKSAGPALLALYAKCGRSQEADRVFDLMDKSDLITWNARILGFSDLGMQDLAINHFREIHRIGFESDHTTISIILPLCDLKLGREIHGFISKKSTLNAVSLVWNALIHMYAKNGSIYTAHLVFTRLEDARDLVSWNTMIGGFGMNGLGEASLQLLQEMRFNGVCPNSLTLVSVLTACSHSGLVNEGLEILRKMKSEFGIEPEKVHYVCVVDSLARCGRLENAVEVLVKMPYKADKHIWGSVLSGALETQNLGIGVQASEQLVVLEPENCGHYVTLSNLYAKLGRIDDAIELRKVMERRGLMKQIGFSSV